jgi:methionyl-tRNA formyltransferase
MKLINCHAGALPFYRGRNILNWALLNDEKEFGVTVHYVDGGIDTGDIIVQDLIPIQPQDDYGSVLEKAYTQCALTLEKALISIKNGTSERKLQKEIHPLGFYCGGRMNGDEWINWEWPSVRIHQFIRAIASPAPSARTKLKDREIAILQSELIDSAPCYICTSGEVVGRNDIGSIVKTGDSTILIKHIADCDGLALVNKRQAKFKIGVRLGFNPMARIIELEKRLKQLEDKIDCSH